MNAKPEKIMLPGQLLSVRSMPSLVTLNDVSDVLLFSQLYADLKSDRFDTPALWYVRYGKAMQELKWTSSYYQRYAFEPAALTDISCEWLIEQGASSHPCELAHFKALLSCMAGLAPDDNLATLFHRSTVKESVKKPGASTLTLQLSTLDEAAMLSSLFMTFTTTAELTPDTYNQVFASSSIVGEIDLRFSRYTWNIKGYEQVREKLQASLSGKKDGLILPLQCDPLVKKSDEQDQGYGPAGGA
ncbi:hypothetical protein SAMN05444064_10946 [Pseudomonas syringae]|uniref:hypothetical protein n=1 Tax=Pseudomonas syringae TaxID=317 RepID=UPI000895FB76|nr:hypothetical protein [Pseudomonas syringae]SDW94020.1 hypothetical protein SAMN05444514_10946 [Pseudomonas syringae]SFM09471.1 hypothetical protein SAMN05444064_10946 [Pseudomonas syringae]